MDFLPTKGIEYLLAIGYLLLLVAVLVVRGEGRQDPNLAAAGDDADGSRARLVPRAGRLPLPSRTYVGAAGRGGLLRVGMDDFARLFLGRPQAFTLPGVGEQLQQGEKGWSVKVDGHEVSLLSPVRGEVAEINAEAVANPSLVQDDPYGRGWLLKIRAPEAGGRAEEPAAGVARALVDGPDVAPAQHDDGAGPRHGAAGRRRAGRRASRANSPATNGRSWQRRCC